MSGKGNCYDSAIVETFFKTKKSELIWRTVFSARAETAQAIARYIQGFYNPVRRHSALNYISPAQSERTASRLANAPPFLRSKSNVALHQVCVLRGNYLRARRCQQTELQVSIWQGMEIAIALSMAPMQLSDSPREQAANQSLEAVRQADLRLAAIGFRLTTRNAALCAGVQPGTGLQFHVLGQYAPNVRPRAERYFGFAGPVGVAGVVGGSPAAVAGVRPDDTLIAINEEKLDPKMPMATEPPTVDLLSFVDKQVQLLAPETAIRVGLYRRGAPLVLTITPIKACRTRFELLLNNKFEALADGELVQIGSRFLDSYTDEEVAVIAAHELAHNILRHRVRLEAAKVSFGLLSEIGRNGRLFRQTEDEADELGVVLLANAGYDPASAARFWRGRGAKIDGGLFRSRTHRGAMSRAKATQLVAAEISAVTPRPIIPPLVAMRDQPFK